MSMETLQELAVKIFYEEDKASKATVADGIKALAGFALGSQVTGFLKDLTHEAIAAGAEIDDFSARLGVGAEELQGFMYAATLSGVSSQEAANGLRVLSAQIEAAAGGSKEAAKNFSDLGVSVKDGAGNARPAIDVFNDVADGFDKLADGPAKAAAAMGIFGGRLGAKFVPLLSEGSAGMAELTAEAERLGVIVSEGTIKQLAEADDAFDSLGLQTKALKMNIGAGLTPVFLKITKIMKERVLPFLTRLTKETKALKYAAGLLAGGIGLAFGGAAIKAAQFFGVLDKGKTSVFGLVKSFLPFFGIALAVGLVALALEDVYTWLTGGESLIGPFLEKFLGVKEAASIADDLREAFKGISVVFDDIKPVLGVIVGELAKLATSIAPVLAKALQFVLNIVVALVDVIALAVNGLKSLMGMGDKGALAAEKDKLVAGMKGGLLGAGKVLLEAVVGKGATLPAPQAPNYNAGAAVGPGIDQKNNVTINVADASGVAGAVKGAIGDANQAAFAAAGG